MYSLIPLNCFAISGSDNRPPDRIIESRIIWRSDRKVPSMASSLILILNEVDERSNLWCVFYFELHQTKKPEKVIQKIVKMHIWIGEWFTNRSWFFSSDVSWRCTISGSFTIRYRFQKEFQNFDVQKISKSEEWNPERTSDDYDPDLDGVTSTVSDPVWDWSVLLLLLGQDELLTEFFVSRHFSKLSKILI